MENNPEWKAFLDAIAEDRHDQSIRLIFADWCDDNGFYDEAAFQRQWTPEWERAKEYLEGFAKRLSRSDYPSLSDDEQDVRSREVTLEELVAAALSVDEHGIHGKWIYLPYQTPDFVWSEREEFWRQIEIYTKKSMTINKRDSFVGCTC